MSSKTLAVTISATRLTGAVIESSIGSIAVTQAFDLPAADAAAGLPVAGPFDRVVATLAPDAAVFRILDLPFRDRRRVSQAVGPALEALVPLSLDDGVLAWDLTTTSATGASVLAALADASRIESVRQQLVDIGAGTPQRLLWAPPAIVSAYRRALGETESFVAIDVSEAGAIVARVEQGHLAVLRVLAPCDAELLERNVLWSLRAMRGEPLRIVVGGRDGEKLRAELSSRIKDAPVEPLPERAPLEGLTGDWRARTCLAGLLLASTGEGLAPLLDFEAGAASLFGARTLRDLQGEIGPLMRWGVAAAALAVLAVGIDYVQLFVERGALSSRAEQIYTSAMPSPSGGAGRKLKMQMRLRELTGKAEAAGTGGGGSPLALLSSLSRDIPKDLEITVDQVDHVPPAAKISGHADSFEAVTKMQESLQKGGEFSRVEVKDVHAAVTGGGVEFLLELTTAEGAGA